MLVLFMLIWDFSYVGVNVWVTGGLSMAASPILLLGQTILATTWFAVRMNLCLGLPVLMWKGYVEWLEFHSKMDDLHTKAPVRLDQWDRWPAFWPRRPAMWPGRPAMWPGRPCTPKGGLYVK
ncbi:hypothetical protein R6Q59_016770 [Mikania micrantha]